MAFSHIAGEADTTWHGLTGPLLARSGSITGKIQIFVLANYLELIGLLLSIFTIITDTTTFTQLTLKIL